MNTYLVAKITTKCHGIMGFDILRAKKAVTDTRYNQTGLRRKMICYRVTSPMKEAMIFR